MSYGLTCTKMSVSPGLRRQTGGLRKHKIVSARID
jgi:hypothetical protein